jgi:hypothetical protein
MAFEIHRREFFDQENDIGPEDKGSGGRPGWRILSIVVVAAILIGLALLFIGRPASGPATGHFPPPGESVAFVAE